MVCAALSSIVPVTDTHQIANLYFTPIAQVHFYGS